MNASRWKKQWYLPVVAITFLGGTLLILIFSQLAGEQVLGPLLKCLVLEAVAISVGSAIIVGLPMLCKALFWAVAVGIVRLLLGPAYVEQKTKRKQRPAPHWLNLPFSLPARPKRLAKLTESGARHKHDLDEMLPPDKTAKD